MLDIKTLMVCNAVLVVFVTISLVVYWSDQKTYYGFGMWIAAAILAALGYALLIPRDILPLWVSILGNITLFILTELCRLDGVIRFLDNRKLPKIYYAIPAPVIGLSMYYYFAVDWIAMRTLLLGISLFLLCLAIFRQLTKYASRNNNRLYWLAAILNIVFGISTLLRGIFWLTKPQGDIFHASVVQNLFLLTAMLYEAGMGTLFLMMNSHRTEEKLIVALTEIKTLSGLLPICSSCKKIRDDKGYWNQIESYISSHSEAKFSHSLCPDCLIKLYPDVADNILNKLNDPPKENN